MAGIGTECNHLLSKLPNVQSLKIIAIINKLPGNEDCNKVIILCHSIKHKWDTLGTHLNVSRTAINSIKEDNNDSGRKLAALITTWIKRERREDHPSWRSLCKALENVDRNLAEEISKDHQCSHTECRVNLPSVRVAREVDIFNIDISPDVSAKDVFRPHSASITSLIVDPVRFGDELVAANLVSGHVVAGIVSQQGVSDYLKASRMVSEVARILSATSSSLTNSSSKILLTFCKVLKKLESKQLDEIVKAILCELGGKTPDAIVSIPVVKKSSEVEKVAEASSHSSECRLQKVSTERIKEIFHAKETALQSVFGNNLTEITNKMWEADMLDKSTKDNPSYGSIIKAFFDCLEFEDASGIEQECEKFLNILLSVGVRGPTKKAVLWLRSELEKLGLKVNVSIQQ